MTDARLEIERNRALLADLTAALLKSQTMFSDQGRLLEEREAAASAHGRESCRTIRANNDDCADQIEELTARLATPDAERRTLEERVAALTKEAAEGDSRLTRLESMNSELRATMGQLDTLLAERDAELQRATQIGLNERLRARARADEHRRAGPHPDGFRERVHPGSGKHPDTGRQRPEPQRGAARADDDRPRS